MTWFLAVSYLVFCALWRVWQGTDNTGLSAERWFRVYVVLSPILLLALTARLFPAIGWWAVPGAVGLGAPAVLAVARGYDDWNKPRMVLHFWPAGLSCVAAWVLHSFLATANPFWPTLAYLSLLALAGAVYPLVFVTLSAFFDDRGHLPTRLCESIVGATVLGGLILFS